MNLSEPGMPGKEKWFLVTGGSRGIGLETARRLSRLGKVVITSRRGMNMASDENNGNIISIVCDNADPEQTEMVATQLLREYGAPSGIVHNAGIADDGLHIHQDVARWRKLADTNFISVLSWHRILLPAMFLHGEGSIVFISSVSAFRGNAGQTGYAATRAALIGIMHSLVHEVSRFGIRVNTIAPGLIETEMLNSIPPQKRERMRKQIPLRRTGTPADVAGAVAFLMSEESSFITGQTLTIDGGMCA